MNSIIRELERLRYILVVFITVSEKSIKLSYVRRFKLRLSQRLSSTRGLPFTLRRVQAVPPIYLRKKRYIKR